MTITLDTLAIGDVKRYLRDRGVAIRPVGI